MERKAFRHLMCSRCRGVEDKLAEKTKRLGLPLTDAAVHYIEG